jgi:preprotein translocase SecE subunit
MSSFGQYLKDTQAELRHVAWPTQTQTIVYTVLVIALSLFVALYLGFFDYLFTSILQRAIEGGVPAADVSQATSTVVNKVIPALSTSTKF